MKLHWTLAALNDYEIAFDYVLEDSPANARELARRIDTAIKKLKSYPLIGRPGVEPGTREWAVARTSYLIVYKVDRKGVTLLRVWHTARDRTSMFAANDED